MKLGILAASAAVVNPSGDYDNTLQGYSGLTVVRNTYIDDGSYELPDPPFAINIGGYSLSSQVYVCSNSFIAFGSASSAYSGFSPSFTGGPVFMVDAGDRSAELLAAGSVKSGSAYRIVFHGANTTSTVVSRIWEVTFYLDGVIVLVTGDIITNGLTGLSDGTNFIDGSGSGGSAISANKAYKYTPSNSSGTSFTITDISP